MLAAFQAIGLVALGTAFVALVAPDLELANPSNLWRGTARCRATACTNTAGKDNDTRAAAVGRSSRRGSPGLRG